MHMALDQSDLDTIARMLLEQEGHIRKSMEQLANAAEERALDRLKQHLADNGINLAKGIGPLIGRRHE